MLARVIRQGAEADPAEGQLAVLNDRLAAWQWAVDCYARITQRVGAQGRLEAMCAEAQRLTGADTVWAMAWIGDPTAGGTPSTTPLWPGPVTTFPTSWPMRGRPTPWCGG